MRRLAALLVFGTVCFVWMQPARAWDNFGHMLVAANAWDNLTPGVKDKVDALLKVNAQYTTWIASAGTADPRKVAFMMAARWPDWIKTQHGPNGYTQDGPNGGDTPPDDPTAKQNIGYSDKLMHKYWHFVDTPYQADKTKTKAPPSVNAKTEIAILRKALRSKKTSDDIKSYDLVWLEHLVGDVHQPLHCTSRFDTADPDGDAGGNKVKITGGGSANELHALWDDFLGTSDAPADAIAKQASLPKADAATAKIATEATWVSESFKEAKKSAYVAPIQLGDGPFAIDAPYTANGQEVSAARIALAGGRLANLLNSALK